MSLYESICTLPLRADLLVQTLHPTEAVLSIGLVSGHVQTYRLPSEASPTQNGSHSLINGNGKRRSSTDSILSVSSSNNGFGHVATQWETRRHKGSCRALAFSTDGATLFSAGTDGIVKAANSETGQVIAKAILGSNTRSSDDDRQRPSVLHTLSPQTLLLGTDAGTLSIYDIREPSGFSSHLPSQTHKPHYRTTDPDPDDNEAITSITPLNPSSTSTSGQPKAWLTTAGSTLAVTDVRKGVIARSIDQGDMLLSSCIIPAAGDTGNTAVFVGGARGYITRWVRGNWEDQFDRTYVGGRDVGQELAEVRKSSMRSSVQTGYRWQASQEENEDEATVDCLTVLPETLQGTIRGKGNWKGKVLAAGIGTGAIRFLRLGENRVVAEYRHDETGIEGVAGLGFDVLGRMISGGGSVVKVWHTQNEDDHGGEEDEEEGNPRALKDVASDSDSDEDDDSSDSEEDKPPQRKKRKAKAPKSGHGILRFEGL